MPKRLRVITEDDLEKITKWRMDPEVTKYMYTDPKLSIKDQRNWFNKINSSNEKKYWIIEIDEGIDVGVLSINNIDYVNKSCSWAYYISDIRARGRGLGRILECNIYDYVFDELNLNKLWCEVFETNSKVIQIHQKFGTKIEGVLKEQIYKNGSYHNVVRMAILKSEWISIKKNYNYEELLID